MKIARMNWMQLQDYLERDDRVVLPLGSVEQHAYLSLATDAILAERVAADAAEPLGVPVYPALPVGMSQAFMAYPGTLTLRPDTYARVLHDLLHSLAESGFRRVLVVNGHRNGTPAREIVGSWAAGRPEVRVRFHDWWKAPRTWAQVLATDPNAGHGSWVENFPWSRLHGVDLPERRKAEAALPPASWEGSPAKLRRELGDGSGGGRYWRPEEQMMEIWVTAVAETRALLESPWWDEEHPPEDD